MKHFIKGRNNLAATIFVPWDCTNNCEFCTSKKDYKIHKGNYLEVKKSIEIINLLDINEVVFTGGEPFANRLALKKMEELIDLVKAETVYINTTLPIRDNMKDVINFINRTDKIKGINISRHETSWFKDTINLANNILTDENLVQIQKPITINCVVDYFTPSEDILEIIDRWSKFLNENLSPQFRLKFRADYTLMDKSTLKSLNDGFSQFLNKHASYVSHGGCDVCFDIVYLKDNILPIYYHKGLEKSSISLGENIFVNDIIIKQDGNIFYDWDGKNEDIAQMILDFKKPLTKKNTKPSLDDYLKSITDVYCYNSKSSCGNSISTTSSSMPTLSSCGLGNHCG